MQVTAGPARIRFGPFLLDPHSGELTKFGRKLRLQEQPFQILVLLLDRPGEVVSREELRQKLWPADTFVDFDHGLNNAVKRLREALSDSSDKPRYVETVPRKGYRFVAQVIGAEASGAASQAVTAPVAQLRRPPSSGRKALAVGIALALASTTVFAGLALRPPTALAEGIHAIAVLPLQNLSGDPAQAYFADGMTDELTTQLAQISALRVVSRNSTTPYRNGAAPIAEIARALQVDAVVEGSVERQGDHVRVTAQLIEAPEDRHLWAGSYDRKLGDALTLQSEVAGEIANQVAARLTPDEKTRLTRNRPVDPSAYDLYLQAKFYAQEENRSDNERAIPLLEEVIKLDPQFAPAYAMLAYEYRTRALEWNRGDEDSNRQAFVAAEKCIELDPALADCYVARATVLWTAPYHFPHASAVADLKHAIALNPNSDEAHHQLANIYNHIGLLGEAQEQITTAARLNPANPGTRFRVAINLIYQGRYEEALGRIRDSQRFSPSLWAFQTSFALFQLGRREEAAEVLRAAEREDHTDTASLLRSMEAMLAAASGDHRGAEQKIHEAIRMGTGFQHFHHTEYGIASAYALLNNHEEALRWLKRASDDGFPCYPLYERDANLANLRNDPRFMSFMDELKAQWERYRETL